MNPNKPNDSKNVKVRLTSSETDNENQAAISKSDHLNSSPEIDHQQLTKNTEKPKEKTVNNKRLKNITTE